MGLQGVGGRWGVSASMNDEDELARVLALLYRAAARIERVAVEITSRYETAHVNLTAGHPFAPSARCASAPSRRSWTSRPVSTRSRPPSG
jgi:hypothetical protein